MNYTLSRILGEAFFYNLLSVHLVIIKIHFFSGWIADNKLVTFLGLCLFAFVISTIVLSGQKSSLKEQLDDCNAEKTNTNTVKKFSKRFSNKFHHAKNSIQNFFKKLFHKILLQTATPTTDTTIKPEDSTSETAPAVTAPTATTPKVKTEGKK